MHRLIRHAYDRIYSLLQKELNQTDLEIALRKMYSNRAVHGFAGSWRKLRYELVVHGGLNPQWTEKKIRATLKLIMPSAIATPRLVSFGKLKPTALEPIKAPRQPEIVSLGELIGRHKRGELNSED